MPYDKSQDPYRSVGTRSEFGRRGRSVTPSDEDDLPRYVKAVTVLAAGDLSILPVQNEDGNTIDYVGVPAGFSPPFQVRRVMATGTTATVATVED